MQRCDGSLLSYSCARPGGLLGVGDPLCFAFGGLLGVLVATTGS